MKKLKTSEIPIKVYQQCQKEQNNQLSEFYKKANKIVKYLILQIKLLIIIQKQILVITRSGASVLGELINLKFLLYQYLANISR